MRNVLWPIVTAFLVSCHAQDQLQVPANPVVVSVRGASILFQPFTIIAVEQTRFERVRCADQEAQRTFRDMRDLFELIYAGRMIKPGEYYGVSAFECVCEGYADYQVERRPSEVVVHCKKTS
jgi:hypothetical protein